MIKLVRGDPAGFGWRCCPLAGVTKEGGGEDLVIARYRFELDGEELVVVEPAIAGSAGD